MSQVAKTQERYAASFQQVAGQLPGQGVDWITDLRSSAIEAWQELGWPTRKQEAWKYTDLTELKETPFEVATGTSKVSPTDLETLTFPDIDAYQVVLVDGAVDTELSELPGDEVTVASIAQVLEGNPELLGEGLGRIVDPTEQPFAALNTALFRDGVLIDVPDNTVVDRPIHVLHIATPATGEMAATVSFPRTFIRLGRSAEASVIETFAATGDGLYWTNAVAEIQAGENASLRHYRLELESEDAFHTSVQSSVQARDATVRTHNVCLGGKLVRNDINAQLLGEGGTCLMNGLFNLHGEQHCDNHTQIDHIEPHCESHQLYKGILDDQARGIFWGRIFVDPQAQKTNADQHNPNLLLSEEALVDSTPQLEIFADDVRCTHGSTFGQLDDEAIFYMRSRGLAHDTAKAVLTYAFAGEVLGTIQLDPVRERVEDLVLARLPKGELARQALRSGGEEITP